MTTSTGTKLTRLRAAATTNRTVLKASPGRLRSLVAVNTAAYSVFLKLYNLADLPTLASDVPLVTLQIEAGKSLNLSELTWFFPTGIAFAITKLVADTDTTVLVAGDLLLTTEHS